VTGEPRGLSPAEQEKLGVAMAEVFAKAREAEEAEQLARSRDRCRSDPTDHLNACSVLG